MEKKRNFPIPFYQRSKWGSQIFDMLIKNGAMNIKEIRTQLPSDKKTGKTITQKVLLETIKIMENEKVIEEIPSNQRTSSYNLTEKFRTKEYDQILLLNTIKKQGFFTDTIKFQHTIYGMPEFEKMISDDQNLTLDLISQIDDALYGLNEIKQRTNSDNITDEIALLSTHPINRTKTVLENIELMLNITINDSMFSREKYEDILAYGNIRKYADIIQTGIICQQGKWVKDIILVKKFKYHKLLRKYYSEPEIKFLYYMIKYVVTGEYKDDWIRWSELEKLVIYKGFQQPNKVFDGGIWYDKNNKIFYAIAEQVIKKINENEFLNLSRIERIGKIIKIIKSKSYPKNIDINHLAMYIEAKSYFEKIRLLKHSRTIPISFTK